jgi:hypothetical protein
MKPSRIVTTHFNLSKRPLAIGLAVFFVNIALAAGELTPLSVSGNRRYLQDASGRPFFLVGDSPQNLPLKLAVSEFDGYMAESASRGFNLLWICIDGQGSDGATTIPPRDKAGRLMMADGWDIGTLNKEYFLTIDAILDAAQRNGIYCMLTPLSECQWTQTNISRNKPEQWKNYGRFLGERYKSRPNLLWQLGNDHISEPAQHAVVEGIKEAGDTHLMTVNWRPGYHKTGSAWVRKHEHGESWIDLDAWYQNGPTSSGGAACHWQKLEYERPNPMPSFLTEGVYQQPYMGQKGSANATDLTCRMQNYYVALGGGCGGHVYGAGWLADKWDYETYRDNGGRIQTRHFKDLFVSRDWTSLVPDYRHTFVTAGYGTLSPTTMDYVGAAINPAGTLGIAYCPKATTITVDLAKFSAPVTARWFDPTNGRFNEAVDGSPFPNRGAREFASPGTNIAGCEDWVLVLENQSPARSAAKP